MKRILHQVMHLCFVFNPKTCRMITLRKPGFLTFIPFFIIGLISLSWFLIRVIPKPSRVTYPCMKVTMPIAYSFIAYLTTMISSILFLKKSMAHLRAN
ncbi:MAG: hypothetical protein JXR41_13665, partial [Bacteroidales bacterium]|nr:hypothetical protein [Bacteroidales bacterium]